MPREIVGFVIGKGGETIKRIQAETGCKVQFTMRKLSLLSSALLILNGNFSAMNSSSVQIVMAFIDS